MATVEDGVYRRKDREGYWIQWVGSDGKRNVLKHLFRLAVEEWAYVLVSPAHGVRPPKKPADRVRFLQPGEMKVVINACPSWLQSIVLLAVTTGMRRGEILGLRWLDVSLEL